MINILIASNNINFAVELMNNFNKSNHYAKVHNITKTVDETLEILNNFNNIDIILMDYNLYVSNDKVFQKIRNKNKYESSCILMTNEETINNEVNDNMIYSVTNNLQENIKDIFEKLLNHKYKIKKIDNLKSKIINELTYLGYDFSYKGTHYLIKAIEYIAINSHKDIDNLERDVYPILSTLYNNSIHNIKCNINRANNIMYCECEMEKLQKYFSFHIDSKPKIKTVINTIINKIS